MSTSSKPASISDAKARPVDLSELQRAAVRALEALSIETTEPLKRRIDDDFQAAFSVAERDLTGSLQKAEATRRERLERLSRRHAERLARIDAEMAAALASVQQSADREQAEAVAEYADARRQAVRQRDENAVMVETVSTATMRGLSDELTAAQRDATGQRRRLDEIERRASAVMQQYGCRSPESTDRSSNDVPTGAPLDTGSAPGTSEALNPDRCLAALEALPPARLGGGTVFLLVLLNLLPIGVGALALWPGPWALQIGIGSGAGLVGTSLAAVGIARVLRKRARTRLHEAARAEYGRLIEALASARAAVDAKLRLAEAHFRSESAKVEAAQKRDTDAIADDFNSRTSQAESRRTSVVQAVQARLTREREAIQRRDDQARQKATEEEGSRRQEIETRFAEEVDRARQVHAQRMNTLRPRHDSALADLEASWPDHLACLQCLLEQADLLCAAPALNWTVGVPSDWAPPEQRVDPLRIGHWRLSLAQLSPAARAQAGFLAGRPATIDIPVLLDPPSSGALLVQSNHEGRGEAISVLRTAMVRLLTSLPPGRVRFTILDPIGLGESFAGFMHLADYAEALIGGRIWTESDQIDAHLVELTAHMETVIQKYLRNEFETIDEYNAQAGTLAEPYRYLVIADFPAKFNDDSVRRLRSIMESGPRCGVFTLIAHDLALPVPGDLPLARLAGRGVHLVRGERGFVYADPQRQALPLEIDQPPADETLTRIMNVFGNAARDRLRVELPFETIVPAEQQLWSATSGSEVSIPLGHAGAVRLQHLRLGRGLSQHVLIAGKTGSGKSNLLHVIITNLALWYGPDEIELYLVDFKEGVEFKAYETHPIPHIRAIAIESDREFGISVLQRLDAELGRRGDLFRAAGVQDLAGYRGLNLAPLPRTLLIVDEFQVFFTEDDRLSQEAAVLLDRLVRQGRAFGIHVLLGSQTLGGSTGLARSTMGQMAVRIALQCSDADSQLILDDTNVAARLLSRAGEAIYNDAGGRVEGNSPFQVAWLPDEIRNRQLDRIGALAESRRIIRDGTVVFEGSAPASIARNQRLNALLAAPQWPADSRTEPAAPFAWLGDAVAIKDPTATRFRRQNGANLLIVSQREDAASALLGSSLLSLAAQLPPERSRFIVLDPRSAEPASSGLRSLAAMLPHAIDFVDFHEVVARLNELAGEVQRRVDGAESNSAGTPTDVYLLVAGLQRYRLLRKQETTFSFSRPTEDDAATPDMHFATLLREGPVHGVHVLAWADTLATVERTFERATLGEFDWRVLFQMSAADSTVLIDTPDANRLGLYRAILFSEEQGLLEKFRPYGPLTGTVLDSVREAMARRTP
ncbi:MAG: DUF87 domain-containing protein [Phycisphaerales bacterium]|nr:DUF87 domain-containing protein [Phycisphaerales bacterium]